MSVSLHVVWDDAFLAYDFGPFHPMAPVRVDLTVRLARELGVLARPGVEVSDAPLADDALLERVHDPAYVAAVRAAGADPRGCDGSWGLGTDDNPAFAGMHEASAHVAGATAQCAERVWRGEARHAVNVAGGLHHAGRAAASGFCVYNDPAVGIARLLELGAERVAYVDVDVHHGDGVQDIFWDDPRVLTVSVHESGRALFPGTGWPYETGGPGAEGSAANLALPAGTGDGAWLRAFHAVVPHLLRAFAPQVLVTQHGCDSHFLDPLAHLALSVDAQRASYAALHDLAHELCGGRWVALGGGGYEVVDVVPRAWTHLLAEAAGHPLDPATPVPAGWREHVVASLGRQPPARMTDGNDGAYVPWSRGYDPADPVDQAVLATRSAVFPLHGLDPLLEE
ncbi:acetoin utilization protein AcuC [Vallicoccus soli]|uniref:Acetoin utilization protein AcuC n=1 Tax=Vallicoccus soli TaxID=2339232 RepID=A0A3A3Z3H0_9ACTN|nr:acetoin utilization protein AcuC [Vallicoccus soli]RJK96075.1 acetoin utilization protein AcuC [Vallicoccus soli]